MKDRPTRQAFRAEDTPQELIALMRAEWDRELERLKEEDPDWVREMLARLS